MNNTDIARLLDRMADLLEIDDANPFRVRAYRGAAQTIRAQSRGMADRVAQHEDLSKLPGIGRDIAAKIRTVVETGHLPQLEKLEERVPTELSDMMRIEGLGAKRVKTLYRELGVRSIDDLRRAARAGRIRALPGFGDKTEHTIMKRVDAWSGQAPRMLIAEVEETARRLLAHLKRADGVKRLVVAGSYRRRRETVGDLDILATARKDSDVIQRFTDFDDVGEVVSHGSTRSTVHLESGLQVDLRVVPEVSYGAALHYFTGSKAHNIALRKMAQKRDLKINEYGVYKGKKRITGRTEDEIYKQFGLAYIEPELRENRGEIEAARAGRLPDLIEVADIRGDLHMHTTATDGRDSLKDMTEAAAERGYEYIAITDHSRRLTVVNGLDEKRLRKQIEGIERLNERLQNIEILTGIEVDILEDGSLDLPDDVLKALDLRVCSIHSKFRLSRKKQTERVLRAMDNPYFNIFAHPTGRLINKRDAYDIDIERVIEGAKNNGCFLEVNAQPDRLDLNDDACRMARDLGVKVAISTDAHSVANLDYMRFGVDQARRGWLEAGDVINTRSLKALKRLLART